MQIYSIDLKFINRLEYKSIDIPNEYYGEFMWVDNDEIYYSGGPYLIFFNIKLNGYKKSIDFNHENVTCLVVFQNEDIVLFERDNSTKNIVDYIIRDKKTKKLYFLNEDGKEEYLKDGGKDYEYLYLDNNVIYDTRERKLTLSKYSILNGKQNEYWTIDPVKMFDRRISRIYKIGEYKNNWLVINVDELYIMDFNTTKVNKLVSFSDEVGKSGAFLKDGRIIKAYVDWGNDTGYDLQGDYFYRLGIFNQQGEFEQEISRDVFVADGTGKISISPDGSKLLVVGIDNEVGWKVAPEVFVYEIIYD